MKYRRKEKEMKNLKRGGKLGCSEKGRHILQWNPNAKTRI
jgi:hypothetical protein